MQSVCCGCHKEVSSNNRKNIFDDELVVSCQDSYKNSEVASPKRIKVCSGIEILTGHKISRIDIESDTLCETCYEKLESYMNFRAQLLLTLGTKSKNLASITDTENTSKTVLEQCTAVSTEEKNNSVPREDSDPVEPKISETKIVSEDVINVEDNSSGPPDVDSTLNEESDTNDSVHSSKQNDQENNNLNESESSNDNSDIATLKEFRPKIQETDIESDIDVCSGEDDEVLELDIQCRKDETVEIGSSSESDIEVCDYEPAGKRIKNYNGLSPPIFF